MSRGNPPRTAGARRLPFAVPAAVREIPRPELALGAGLLIGNLAFLVSRFNFAAAKGE